MYLGAIMVLGQNIINTSSYVLVSICVGASLLTVLKWNHLCKGWPCQKRKATTGARY